MPPAMLFALTVASDTSQLFTCTLLLLVIAPAQYPVTVALFMSQLLIMPKLAPATTPAYDEDRFPSTDAFVNLMSCTLALEASPLKNPMFEASLFMLKPLIVLLFPLKSPEYPFCIFVPTGVQLIPDMSMLFSMTTLLVRQSSCFAHSSRPAALNMWYVPSVLEYEANVSAFIVPKSSMCPAVRFVSFLPERM